MKLQLMNYRNTSMIETGRNPLGIACAVIRTLRDFGLLDEKKFHPNYNDNPKSQSFVAGW